MTQNFSENICKRVSNEFHWKSFPLMGFTILLYLKLIMVFNVSNLFCKIKINLKDTFEKLLLILFEQKHFQFISLISIYNLMLKHSVDYKFSHETSNKIILYTIMYI